MSGDGKVSAADIQLAINAFLGCIPKIYEMFADANGDGSCDAVDIQRVINAVLGGDCDGNPCAAAKLVKPPSADERLVVFSLPALYALKPKVV